MQCNSAIIIKNLCSKSRKIAIDLEWQISYFIKYIDSLIKSNVLDFLPSEPISNLKFVHNGISINIFDSKCMLEVSDFPKSLKELGIKNNDIIYVFIKANNIEQSHFKDTKQSDDEKDFDFDDTFEYGKTSSDISNSDIMNKDLILEDTEPQIAVPSRAMPTSTVSLNTVPISTVPISTVPISTVPISTVQTSTVPISTNISYTKPPIGPSSAPSSVAPIATRTTPRRLTRNNSTDFGSKSIILEISSEGIYDRASDSYTMLSLSPQDRSLIEDLKSENQELRSELKEIKQYLKCIVKSIELSESNVSLDGSVVDDKNNETDDDTNFDCIL